MSTPTQVLGQFWDELRETSRVRVELGAGFTFSTILCAGKNQEQIELLEVNWSGTVKVPR